ncbi:MAG TPA: acyltransferase [Edaphobacter sp.]|uniref:acyltransferase family protein n=1 Tax=Edaphobacter sp. TaxID=1934404 RepID=UPI002C0DBDA7|nr:acyltransferase [Edaphobacter sp.]HUZ93685.1 acyltransferase [Edaphobacter sp.]
MNDLNISLPVQKAKRFYELDSMRGLAALIVVFSHFRNMFYLGAGLDHGVLALLYPLVAAHESVIFFFLLSGFVLTLPFLRSTRNTYSTFVHRRVLRIYGPYIVALVIAIIGCAIWHGRVSPIGWGATIWEMPVTFKSVVNHILFIGNYNFRAYNPVIWSLVYEMRVSLIFPFLFLMVFKFRIRYTLIGIAACTCFGVTPSESKSLITLEYIGIFLIGILLAIHKDELARLYRTISPRQRLLFFLLSAVLYLESHRLIGLGPLWHLGDMPIALGAAGFIIVGLNSSAVKRVLNSSIPHFLGTISYSLYLIHGLVLFAMTATLRTKVSHPVFFVIYFPTAVLLSWAFYAAVEKPFMLWSHKVGRRKTVPVIEPVLAADS